MSAFEADALPFGQPSDRSKWTPEGIEPSFPGCKPGVFPLDDGPIFNSCCGKDSNLQPWPSEGRALFRLSYRNSCLSFAPGPMSFAFAKDKGPMTRDIFLNGPGRI